MRISDCFLHKISCIDANLNEVKSQFETVFFLKQTKNNVSLFTLSKYSLGIRSSTKALSVIYKKKKRKSLESTEKPYSKNFCFKSDFLITFFHKCLKYLINDTLILVLSFEKQKHLLHLINEFKCKRSNFY